MQALTLFALRALGVVDARARGLVVQTVLPGVDTVARRAARRAHCSVAAAIQSVTARSAASRLRALLVRLEHGELGVGRRAGADDGAAAVDLGGAAERRGVRRGVLDHALEHLGDRHRAVRR